MLCRRNIRAGWLRRLCPPLARALEKQSWTSILERIVIWACNGFTKKDLWATDIALFGQDITRTKEYKEADVIHLHWVNQGFLSLRTIGKIARSGKKVVWTMHDEWPLDGVEHYTNSPTPAPPLGEGEVTEVSRDISPSPRVGVGVGLVLRSKKRIYSLRTITFVTCSRWLREISERKELAQGQRVVNIPNPIDSALFAPLTAQQRAEYRALLGLPEDKRLVLFVAQNVKDERKGVRYLDEACALFDDKEILVVALGRDLPYISKVEDMARLYAAVDVFVTPSLSDNLPNTIMEAMACGTPCVGFNVGGIPEMIDHRENGYVARYKDARDLADGIRYVLSRREELGVAAREKVLRCYSEEAVAKRYLSEYSRGSGSSGLSGSSGSAHL